MKTVLVTGANGFVGRNLCVALSRREDVRTLPFGRENTTEELDAYVQQADFIFHLAGINRPRDEAEFQQGNTNLTQTLCELATKHASKAPILLSSSTQVERDTPYAVSKKAAEEILIDYSKNSGVAVLVYQLPNLFGKWSRPNYNSVVSTFCHNIAHDLPIEISNPDHVVNFAYVDDVIRACLQHLDAPTLNTGHFFYELALEQVHPVSLGKLANTIRAFHQVRQGGPMPDLSDPFSFKLYTTFISYYDLEALAYPVDLKTDDRGWLFELIKSEQFGQIFVSTTHPGITRGNHFHDSKIEKFCVIQGSGTIRFRHVQSSEVIEYSVSDQLIQIVDITPGYTHSIENTGEVGMITLFWANEIFDPDRPDTYFDPVLSDA